MADQEFKLRYVIQGDASGMRSANRELEKTDKAITKLGKGGNLSDFLGGIAGVATGDQLNGVTSQISSASQALSALPGPAGIAATALALTGVAAVGLGVALFKVTQNAAEFGSEIYDASQQTGLGAETLSALKLAADTSSSSLSDVTGAVTKFSKTVGEAALGSEKAAAALERLGISPQEAIKDLDGALADVFKRINDLPPGVNQTKAAIDAFGKSGASLIPVITATNGNLREFIAEAKRLGVTLTDEDAAAADEFGDQVDVLSAQVKGLGFAFGRELMPVFLGAARDISGWLVANKGEIKSWGEATRDGVSAAVNAYRGLLAMWREMSSWMDANPTVARVVLGVSTLGVSEAYQGAKAVIKGISTVVQPPQMPDFSNIGKKPQPDSDYLENLEAQRKAAEDARKEREELMKRDAAAQVQILQGQADATLKIYEDTLKKQKKILEDGGSVEGFKSSLSSAIGVYNQEISEIIPKLYDAEDRAAGLAKKTDTELQLMQQQRVERTKQLNDRAKGLYDEANDAVKNANKKASDEQIKAAKEASDRNIALYDATIAKAIASVEYKVQQQTLTEMEGVAARQQLEDQAFEYRREQLEKELKLVKGNKDEVARINHELQILQTQRDAKYYKNLVETAGAAKKTFNEILEEINTKIKEGIEEADDLAEALEKAFSEMAKAQKEAFDNSFTGGFFGAIGLEAIKSEADYIKSVYADMGSFIGDIVTGMAQGVGSMVEAWVLYGELGPDALRKMTAQVLASVAAEAAVRAVMELAYGFAALFFNPAEAAAHFTAAALFGSIATGAALAGRAVAGDSFKKDAAGAGASGGSASSSSSSQTPATYSRVSETAYMSGSRDDNRAFKHVMEKLDATLNKFQAVKPGYVLMEGMREKKGAILKQAAMDAKGDSRSAQDLVKRAGVR